ncbi:MAG TPA: ABC transporter substrate-binding protein [Xanthobacteraceae bacterium]|jgi:putative ABC transport system substrate-binding protein|nr:ABC transporter substrate-binding protein [Xanthobacteraceae bacterium]
MRRREFNAIVSGWAMQALTGPVVLLSPEAGAQPSSRRPLVALLSPGTQASSVYYNNAFFRGIHELGYMEGRDVDFVERYADGFLDRLPAITEEVVRLNPDAILAQTSSAGLVASRATKTIPIVVAAMADRLGMIGSDAHPAGNVTGILVNLEGLAGKQLQIAHDVVPGSKRLGLLFNAANPGIAFQRQEFDDAATRLGIDLMTAEVRSPDDLDAAFARLAAERVGIVLVAQDAMLSAQRGRIAGLAAGARLPLMAGQPIFAGEGAVITYGINPADNYHRAAEYIGKILKGTKPADLPVELPTKLEMIVNLKTAKALNIAIPLFLLQNADEVIE